MGVCGDMELLADAKWKSSIIGEFCILIMTLVILNAHPIHVPTLKAVYICLKM